MTHSSDLAQGHQSIKNLQNFFKSTEFKDNGPNRISDFGTVLLSLDSCLLMGEPLHTRRLQQDRRKDDVSSNKRDKPFFTIITPSFNQGSFIGRTIESVILQNFDSLEYIIFDGGSTDGTLSILKRYGDSIRWTSETDKGQAHAVNKGLNLARGQVIGWLNSDDVYYQGALRAVRDAFVEHPEIEILYGMADQIDEYDDKIEPYYHEEWNYARLREICHICQPAVFFRKSIVDRFGMLDETLNYCMDYEYWLRIGKEKPFYYLKKRIAGSRRHKDSKTITSPIEVHLEILKMFGKKFENIPDRWILAYAEVVARSLGPRKGNIKSKLEFLTKLFLTSISTSLKMQHRVPLSLLRMMAAGSLRRVRSRVKPDGR